MDIAIQDQSTSSLSFPMTQEIEVDLFASATKNLPLMRRVYLLAPMTPKVGDAVVVRVRKESTTYNLLEQIDGQTVSLRSGDILVGVLGRRKALKGFVGDLPVSLRVGDTLHLLNQGGVLGCCTGQFHELSAPVEVEFLGMIDDGGKPMTLTDYALPHVSSLPHSAPIIIIAGTCMHAGKTQAASALVGSFAKQGYRVAGAKLSGVACLRDTLRMEAQGAIKTMSFLDCGHPSTVGVDDLTHVARQIVAHLNHEQPDVIVMELGDGLLGGYRVDAIFDDAELMAHCRAVVFCAHDFVGAWGGIHLLKQKGVHIDVITGSATDSPMGVDYIQGELGIAAANAIRQPEQLFALVEEKIAPPSAV
jgi:hypothetical protein